MEISNTLIKCFIYLIKHYDIKLDINAVLKNLPLNYSTSFDESLHIKNKDFKKNIDILSNRLGLMTKVMTSSLKDISVDFFPIIAFDKNHNACIIEYLNDNELKLIDFDNMASSKVISYEKYDNIILNTFILVNIDKNNEINSNGIDYRKKHWFWNSLSFSKTLYLDIVLASLFINIFILLTPLYTMNIYDRVVPNSAFDTLWVLSIAILVVYVFDFILRFLRMYLLELASKKSDVFILTTLFENVLRIKLFNTIPSVGKLASYFKEYDAIRTLLTSSSLILLIDLPFVIIFLMVIYYIAPDVIVINFLAIFFIIVFSILIKKPLAKSIKNSSESYSQKQKLLIESLSSIETIKSFDFYPILQYKWEKISSLFSNDELKTKYLTNLTSQFAYFITQVNNVLVIMIGVYLISEQKLTLGGLIAIYMLSSRALNPIHNIANLLVTYEQAKIGYQSINSIVDLPKEENFLRNFLKQENIYGSIKFNNVSFQYPQTDKLILDDVSFEINMKEKVGIVGLNGSGKSTILKLIMGLYEPQKGSILIDGINITQHNYIQLRQKISYIPQNISLLQGSIYENVMEFREDIDENIFLDVSVKSGLDRFINTTNEGYKTDVGEMGQFLSGGQKQSVGIARALIKQEASISLFDEPTNSLDSLNEMVVEESLKEFIEEQTLILITHKNSLLKLVDRILVLRDGKIVLDGKRDMVIQKLKGK